MCIRDRYMGKTLEPEYLDKSGNPTATPREEDSNDTTPRQIFEIRQVNSTQELFKALEGKLSSDLWMGRLIPWGLTLLIFVLYYACTMFGTSYSNKYTRDFINQIYSWITIAYAFLPGTYFYALGTGLVLLVCRPVPGLAILGICGLIGGIWTSSQNFILHSCGVLLY
eukprot:TRINITY_DN1503_c0_g1_i3.p1 TRINITY_DN1503_c0_g1~~TRINITY_DN1503_c0_g1_i3.p1  ORF type:complete len:188 (-),score=40.04 TRINITY_DN1503_c0_g1_i3:157-660(-)